ncbi:hypothetical protein A2160_01915 [Candidatus Beckwithbacteria bacterium RBG_13_42_9]|uniref:DUF3800 domain-containing protein n=1 Tax=Candidatus Beckwithbacteria bacterium RBG_13_42_9 TaxID=1797457 RepID=A0A1F5E8C5_9BACT|nr:MAG: hypothetical protein A2160_01915 [Candidatus Beckwithbacteria bacterium RBG_13_42_9]
MNYYHELFIDELGNVNPVDTKSDIYVLCGCAVEKFQREVLKTKADQIKFKYWSHTEVVFHSRELGIKGNQFEIFKGKKKLREDFLSDLFQFLKQSQFTIFVIVCDKSKAKQKGWNSTKIIKTTGRKLFYHYISWLLGLKRGSGKITIESATAEKDRYYLNEFSYFLAPGCRELSVDYRKVQSILTSISFVTKHNADIEEQIADLFSYAAKCKYLRLSKQQSFKVGTYEDKIIRLLDLKLFRKPRFAREFKMKFYESIDPFCILPKK